MAKVGYCSCFGTPSIVASRKSASFPHTVRRRQESEADEFAVHLLIPEEELQKLKGKGTRELAEYFGVPEEMVKLRLTLFRADT
jgi:Zn-dependent peptidase ImmA (M78 family)